MHRLWRLQLVTMWATAASMGGRVASRPLVNVPMKFFGYYLLWTPLRQDQTLYVALGIVLIGVLVVSAFVRRKTLDFTFVALVGALAVSITLAAVRAPLDVMHPVLAGGRYFFLPYILLSWLLLDLIDRRYQGTSVFCAAALVLALGGFVMHARWRHVAIDWGDHIEKCVAETVHQFPIHYEGTQAHRIIWAVDVPGEACRKLVARSLFDNRLGGLAGQGEPR